MGLDTTHGAWHGPYSSFNRFRRQLAERIGINLDDYRGYNKFGTKDLESIDHDLMPLFNHSDCDGELSIEECFSIARGLLDVVQEIKLDEMESLEMQLFYDACHTFMKGCLNATAKRECIEFH